MADLIIPAKTFLEKNDIRTSYSTHYMYEMPRQKVSEIGISEYELTKYLCDAFDISLKNEEDYIAHFRSFAAKNEEGILEVKGREQIAYENGFTKDDDEFLFLEELDSDRDESDDLYLLTCKSATSLNSQFKVNDKVYLHPSLGYEENQLVEVSSLSGTVRLHVALDERLRADCVLIYSGTSGINHLTTSKKSYEGNSAVYEQNRVKLTTI